MIVHTLLDSSNLAGNLLGDPSERNLFVYLPPGCRCPRTMQRKPRWLVEESIAWPCRAAGR